MWTLKLTYPLTGVVSVIGSCWLMCMSLVFSIFICTSASSSEPVAILDSLPLALIIPAVSPIFISEASFAYPRVWSIVSSRDTPLSDLLSWVLRMSLSVIIYEEQWWCDIPLQYSSPEGENQMFLMRLKLEVTGLASVSVCTSLTVILTRIQNSDIAPIESAQHVLGEIPRLTSICEKRYNCCHIETNLESWSGVRWVK